MYGSNWVLNDNFQSQLERGHTQADAMVCPNEDVLHWNSPIPRIPSCLEDVWEFATEFPVQKIPSQIEAKMCSKH